jgi:hypothetical protein
VTHLCDFLSISPNPLVAGSLAQRQRKNRLEPDPTDDVARHRVYHALSRVAPDPPHQGWRALKSKPLSILRLPTIRIPSIVAATAAQIRDNVSPLSEYPGNPLPEWPTVSETSGPDR